MTYECDHCGESSSYILEWYGVDQNGNNPEVVLEIGSCGNFEHMLNASTSGSNMLDILDENTKRVHQNELRNGGFVIDYKEFVGFGINLNIALAGALIKVLGVDKEVLMNQVRKSLRGKAFFKESLKAAEAGYNSQENKYDLKKLKRKLSLFSGSKAVAIGAINSKIDLYFAYPMTPATNALHELAARQIENNFMTFQPENEIAVVNMALGASFAGAKVMIGTSGGGFDLMTEGLSLQGSSELPLVVYLASRPGPGTGIPTYTLQGDLDIALRAGHGEFPRVVIAPGDPTETVEKVNESLYLANKFNCLVVLLSDKHIAESEFSSMEKINKIIDIKVTRKVPGEEIVKASSYEHDEHGTTTENAEIAVRNAHDRLHRYELIREESKKFEMVKFYGKKNSKNLIIGWGSTKGAIVDAIEDLDYKFLQVLYMKPMSSEIKKEMVKAKKVVLVENNLTGQLGRLIREKTGLKIDNRILRYDGRPFRSDELRRELMKIK